MNDDPTNAASAPPTTFKLDPTTNATASRLPDPSFTLPGQSIAGGFSPPKYDAIGALILGVPEVVSVTSADRDRLVEVGTTPTPTGRGGVFRKTARIVAMQAIGPFVVATEHGAMRGEAGDWLATNHPDDDSSSDVWPISAERFAASYAPATATERSATVESTNHHILIRVAIDRIRTSPAWGTHSGIDRNLHLAVTALEDALLRLNAEDVL